MEDLRCASNVQRMSKRRMVEKIFRRTRRKARPAKWWLDDIEENLRSMDVLYLQHVARDRREWGDGGSQDLNRAEAPWVT